MQPEVLFKETPPEVFLTAWCVALNYTCKALRANQLGVLQIDSSLRKGVSKTTPLISLLSSLTPRSVSERSEEFVIEGKTESQ